SPPLLHALHLFVFYAPPPPALYPLSLHDALPISVVRGGGSARRRALAAARRDGRCAVGRLRDAAVRPLHALGRARVPAVDAGRRSEEHTSELQSLTNLVCRLLLEKKKHPATRRHH